MTTTILTDTPRVFLTDYASYNEGTQFEFGHWVDLTDFSDFDELQDYITDHFAECDEKSPLKCGSSREETMYTDYENFPSFLYSESGMTEDDFDKIIAYGEIKEQFDNSPIGMHNRYCSEANCMDDYIYDNDEDFFEEYFSTKDEAVRAVMYGDYNYSDDHVQFNGYGNLESFGESQAPVIEDDVINFFLENTHLL